MDTDSAYLRLVCPSLKKEGYRVTCGVTGEEALTLLAKRKPDLMLLEILLPGVDGFEVCRRVREVSTVPIIILTSMDTEEHKVKGLRLGADDYIAKPFAVPELLARVDAVLRRAQWAEAPSVQTSFIVGELTIDRLQRRVTLGGQEVAVSPTEYQLLCYLAASPRVVLTHDYLLEKVWGPGHRPARETLRTALWRLRQKLEKDPSNPRLIITHPGVGYMIDAA